MEFLEKIFSKANFAGVFDEKKKNRKSRDRIKVRKLSSPGEIAFLSRSSPVSKVSFRGIEIFWPASRHLAEHPFFLSTVKGQSFPS